MALRSFSGFQDEEAAAEVSADLAVSDAPLSAALVSAAVLSAEAAADVAVCVLPPHPEIIPHVNAVTVRIAKLFLFIFSSL